MRKTGTIAFVLGLALAVHGCSGGDAEPGQGGEETPSGGEEAAAQEPAAAGPLGVPLADVERDHLTSSLEAGGWEVRSVSTSGSFTTVLGMKDDQRATISYQNPTQPPQRGYIESRGGVVHVEDDVLLGVTVEDDAQTAQAILDAMLGR